MTEYISKIKAINKITLTKICNELKVNRSNLLNGKTTKENEKKVYKKYVEELKKQFWLKIINELYYV